MVRTVNFPNEYFTKESRVADYSPAADLFAIVVDAHEGRGRLTVELRKGANGALVRRIASVVARNPRSGPIDAYIAPGGDFLSFRTSNAAPGHRAKRWRYWLVDVRTGEIRMFESPERADAVRAFDVKVAAVGPGGAVFQTLIRAAPPGAWLSIAVPHEPTRRVRIPSSERVEYKYDQWNQGLVGINVKLVPNKSEAIISSVEPSLQANLPGALRKLMPTSAAAEEHVTRHRWYDWAHDDWRLVGCPDAVTEIQVRPNALLTISPTSAKAVLLQSWPLPPRDPKPPALAIAALCTAATWWLCAWRYRRRIRRAAVGAA